MSNEDILPVWLCESIGCLQAHTKELLGTQKYSDIIMSNINDENESNNAASRWEELSYFIFNS